MDHEIDKRCEAWARELFGGAIARLGYPSASLQQRTSRGLQTMSDEAFEVERAVHRLGRFEQRVIKVHYLHPGNTMARMSRLRISTRHSYYVTVHGAQAALREELFPVAR